MARNCYFFRCACHLLLKTNIICFNPVFILSKSSFVTTAFSIISNNKFFVSARPAGNFPYKKEERHIGERALNVEVCGGKCFNRCDEMIWSKVK